MPELQRPTRTKRELLHSGKRILVYRDEFQLAGGQTATREIVEHGGAVVILPRTSAGTFLLLKQYRYPFDDFLIEFPAGTIEPQEEPFACAQREITEEVKVQAEKWTALGQIVPAPGFCSERQFGFLAESLTPCAQAADADEVFEIVELSVPEIESAIRSGTIYDAKSIAFFYRASLQGFL